MLGVGMGEQEFLEALRSAYEAAGKPSYPSIAAALPPEVRKHKDTVRLWIVGEQPMWPDEVFALADALGVDRAELSRHLGYVPADRVKGFPTLNAAIEASFPPVVAGIVKRFAESARAR